MSSEAARVDRLDAAGRRAALAALIALPAVLQVWLAFHSGGFFAGATGMATAVLLGVVAVRALVAPEPFAGLGKLAWAAVAALALYSAWTLASSAWSDSSTRAVIEFDRALLYVLAVALFASVTHGPARLRWAVRLVAAGGLAVIGAGVLSRLAPELVTAPATIEADRLSYPLGYWNAVGFAAVLTLILAFHLAASDREPWPVRVLGAAAVPVACVALLLTYSRGAMVVAVIGLVAYLLAARARGALTAALATVPPAAIALVETYHAELVSSYEPTTPAALAQGRALLAVLGWCVLAAAAVRLVLVPVDRRLARVSLGRARRPVFAACAVAAVAAVAVMVVATPVPNVVSDQYQAFVEGKNPRGEGPVRTRLTSFSSNHRLDHWRVALDESARAPFRGSGAGTYTFLWARERPIGFTVYDGHSLYFEALGEFGWLGLGLVVAAVALLLAGAARRLRGPDRHVHAAVFALVLAWALHAGVDWDWEIPAITLPVLALAGMALARDRVPAPGRWRRARPVARAAVAAGALALTFVPLSILTSQNALDRSIAAFKRDDCATATREARTAASGFPARPEAHEVVGFCEMRERTGDRGVGEMERAVRLDPGNWRLRYALALTEGAAARDPAATLAEARRMNPFDPHVARATEAFERASSRRARKRVAMRLPLVEP